MGGRGFVALLETPSPYIKQQNGKLQKRVGIYCFLVTLRFTSNTATTELIKAAIKSAR